MSVTELKTVDMAELLTYAYELGDMINNSIAVSDYLFWKRRVEEDAEIQVFKRKLAAQKELFEETQRFGHFHPNYHEAKDKVAEVEKELEQFEAVRNFKAAEKELDELLHQMSEMIAYSVSDTIKVPSNDLNPIGGGCGSGGKCSCG
ncbi:YlbF family regulator [Paenibacillus bouchesdurhonensis]|uniref:YlbF family regulator n=1 Tax=Paenibacillus bouchesdurhonensis TaxID=1870990 RepID=UPI000DA5F8B5|nr:YlbF family regulator [Paenibacillus bouchesdurhonensis]